MVSFERGLHLGLQQRQWSACPRLTSGAVSCRHTPMWTIKSTIIEVTHLCSDHLDGYDTLGHLLQQQQAIRESSFQFALFRISRETGQEEGKPFCILSAAFRHSTALGYFFDCPSIGAKHQESIRDVDCGKACSVTTLEFGSWYVTVVDTLSSMSPAPGRRTGQICREIKLPTKNTAGGIPSFQRNKVSLMGYGRRRDQALFSFGLLLFPFISPMKQEFSYGLWKTERQSIVFIQVVPSSLPCGSLRPCTIINPARRRGCKPAT